MARTATLNCTVNLSSTDMFSDNMIISASSGISMDGEHKSMGTVQLDSTITHDAGVAGAVQITGGGLTATGDGSTVGIPINTRAYIFLHNISGAVTHLRQEDQDSDDTVGNTIASVKAGEMALIPYNATNFDSNNRTHLYLQVSGSSVKSIVRYVIAELSA